MFLLELNLAFNFFVFAWFLGKLTNHCGGGGGGTLFQESVCLTSSTGFLKEPEKFWAMMAVYNAFESGHRKENYLYK